MSKIPPPCAIRSPGDLRRLLEALRSAIDGRTLEEQPEKRSQFASEVTLSDLTLGGPWPDYFELHFKAPNSEKLYKLEAETYHGAGGQWSEV